MLTDAEKTSERREMQAAAMRHDLTFALPLREIVLEAVKRGVDLRYLSMRYNVALDRLERARAAIEAKKQEGER